MAFYVCMYVVELIGRRYILLPVNLVSLNVTYLDSDIYHVFRVLLAKYFVTLYTINYNLAKSVRVWGFSYLIVSKRSPDGLSPKKKVD